MCEIEKDRERESCVKKVFFKNLCCGGCSFFAISFRWKQKFLFFYNFKVRGVRFFVLYCFFVKVENCWVVCFVCSFCFHEFFFDRLIAGGFFFSSWLVVCFVCGVYSPEVGQRDKVHVYQLAQ